LQYLEKHGAKVDVMERELKRQDRRDKLLKKLQKDSYDALYVCLEDVVDKEVVEASQPKCKVISTMSVGFNHIDVPTCKKHSIEIGFTPEVLTETTADLVVALTLATARMLIPANRAVYSGEWGMWTPLWMCGKDVWGSTIGFVGLGRIGLAAAKRFQGFGCKILYCNSSNKPKPEADKLGFKFTDFDSVMSQADFVVPLCPLTPATKGMFGMKQFQKMKKDAIFINATRGDMVVQDDLVRALKEGVIAAAGLDVTTPEPLPTNHELLSLPNCTVLPHIGSASVATRNKMAVLAAENIVNALQGKKGKYFVA